jgi:hypothetical protein
MAVAADIDLDAEYWKIVNREFGKREKRLRPPVVKLYDGNWTLRGRVMHFYNAEFREIELETGIGKFEMPEEYYLSKWVTDHDKREFKNIHVSCEKDGIRWTGRLDYYEIESDKNGKTVVRCIFKHDYEELKHMLCWANPFLPAELQFPKVWLLFGQAKWAIKTTLLANIMRLESSLWMLPDNPLDISQWFNFDQSTWSMVVAPDQGEPDNSPLAVVYSRFKYAHDAIKNVAEDAQLTPVFRRYFDGDDPPWPGADLRHGCLIIDFEDNSGWQTGTSFGGSIFTGLIHALVNIGSDGLTEGIDIIDDPAWPEEYYQEGWIGTLPVAPGIIYRQGDNTGIQTSLFRASEAKDIQHVAGGHSARGVNEAISFAVQMAGDLIAMIIGVPPVGGAVDAVLRPLYSDVFLAFQAWKDTGRAQRLGFSHYQERLAEGADRAYSLQAIIALRTSIWSTREMFTHKFTVADGRPWLVGARGKGHFYLGHRIGSTAKGTPKGKIYVDRVREIALRFDRSTAPTWEITVGERVQEDPIIKAFERIQELFGIARDLGLV